jgi:hypothetical protein
LVPPNLTSRLEDVKKLILKFAVNSAFKNRSRLPYKRPLGCRQAFGIKNKIAKNKRNRFFHIFRTQKFDAEIPGIGRDL